MLNSFDISSYVVVPVVLVCCLIGYVIKNYTKLNNRFIPACMLVIGILTNIVLALTNGKAVDVATIICGGVSGLASSGFYDLLIKSIFPKKKEELETLITEAIENSVCDTEPDNTEK